MPRRSADARAILLCLTLTVAGAAPPQGAAHGAIDHGALSADERSAFLSHLEVLADRPAFAAAARRLGAEDARPNAVAAAIVALFVAADSDLRARLSAGPAPIFLANPGAAVASGAFVSALYDLALFEDRHRGDRTATSAEKAQLSRLDALWARIDAARDDEGN